MWDLPGPGIKPMFPALSGGLRGGERGATNKSKIKRRR
jgi:hypothetical protein